MLVEKINMSTNCIWYIVYIINMFKDLFTVRNREDRVKMDSDMTLSEDALVQF